MKNNKLVSVIIPCFNGEKYVSDTIQSVLEQTYTQVEIIVIDDGSTDSSSKEIKKFGSKVRYVYQKNQGLPIARNVGIGLAKGEYIQFLDADDLLRPSKLEKQVEFLNQNPKINVCYSSWMEFTDSLSNLSSYKFDISAPPVNLIERIISISQAFPIAVHSLLYRRTLVDKVGFFNEYLMASEDREYLLRIVLMGEKFGFLKQWSGYYRQHPTNMTKNFNHMIGSFYSFFQQSEKLLYEYEQATHENLMVIRDNYYCLLYLIDRKGCLFNKRRAIIKEINRINFILGKKKINRFKSVFIQIFGYLVYKKVVKMVRLS